DATPDGGIARGFSLSRHPEFGGPGWQPAYPETTGYIVPTLYAAAELLESPSLAARATFASRWEIEVQLTSGAVRGGTITAPPTPAIFNTGQVLLGWLATVEHNGDASCADAAHRAASFLVAAQDRDGAWRRSQSRFADATTTMYNTRTAWALAEAGERLGHIEYSESASRALRAMAYQQHRNGWLPSCCLNDADRPLLHTLGYAIEGLIEGGRVLNDAELVWAGARAARAIAQLVSPEGWLPGRLTSDWAGAVNWSCLTGQAQMVNVWFRLHELTGDPEWLEPVPRVIAFLKSTQDRVTRNPGRRGGIKGALPVTGDYGRLEVLSWATKFFADTLMRSMCFYGRRRAPSALALA
ncbi:MAG TPA: hypothetical protein VF483_03575, partial [Gemmatimonadaceae bacterium]